MVFVHQALFALLFPILTVMVSGVCWLTAGIGKNALFAHKVECLWARCALFLAGTRVQTELAVLDPGASYVFMANHQSNFDILVLFSCLRKWNMRFVAKESLFAIPIFGPAMRRTGHIAILRENSRKALKSIDDAVTAAKRGISVLIFPEGTRGEACEHLGEFKIGGMIMALKCGLPVAPLIVAGTRQILPRGAKMPRPGRVRVRALPPFNPSEGFTMKEREKLKDWLKDYMEHAYQENEPCRT